MAKKKNKMPKTRNMAAYCMLVHGTGAGSHGDDRKENSRKACRGKVSPED